MFSNLLSIPLLACLLSLQATVCTASHVNGIPGLLQRHHELAKRSDGDVQLFKRYSGTRWSFYETQTGNAGSCGRFLSDSGFTVAVNIAQMNSGLCFKSIRMTYNGRSTTATVQDTCPGCPWGGLDLSPGLFSFFAPQSAGIIYGDWEFTDGTGNPPPLPPKPTPKPAPTPKPHTTSTPVWTPPSTTSTKQRSTTSTTSTSSPSSSAVTSSTVDNLVGPATPTSAVVANLEDLYQIFVQIGSIVAAGANI